MPVEITCGLLKKAMERNGWAEKKYLIDGFPRNQDNYDGWVSVMGDSVEVPFIFHFDADEDTLVERIMERSKSSGRNDDNIETLRKRLKTFENETMPIINYYDSQGKCKKINGLQSVDEVFADVIKEVQAYI